MDDERQPGAQAPTTYEICVAGALDPTWSYALEGLAFSHESGAEGQRITVLRGPLDQAALAAVLDALFRLNLTVQSVQLIDPGHHVSQPIEDPPHAAHASEERVDLDYDTSSRGSHRAQ